MSKVRRKHQLRVPRKQDKVARLTDFPPPEKQSIAQSNPHKILQLQQHFGNRAVQRMLHSDTLQRQVLGQIGDALGPLDTEITDPVLGLGSQGPDVIRLQRRLNLHGGQLVEDGEYGSATFGAVRTFQETHDLQPTGIVRQGTWNSLNQAPITTIDQNKLVGQTSADLPLSQLPVGAFAGAVGANFIEHDIAALLNDLHNTVPVGGFSLDGVDFARQELGNGGLIGIVTVSKIGSLRGRLPFSFHNTINEIEKDGIIVNDVPRTAVQITRFSKGMMRGLIVVNDAELEAARPAGATEKREFIQQVLLHEINHLRNREEVLIDLTTPITHEEYVDVPEALRLQKFGKPMTTTEVRATFIQESAAQHIEFLLKQERIQAEDGIPEPLLPGEFFNAALDFAERRLNGTGDNGYLKKLFETDKVAFQRQIGLWMRNLNERDFHGDAVQNLVKRGFFEIEFQMAQAANFSKFASRSRGLRD